MAGVKDTGIGWGSIYSSPGRGSCMIRWFSVADSIRSQDELQDFKITLGAGRPRKDFEVSILPEPEHLAKRSLASTTER